MNASVRLFGAVVGVVCCATSPVLSQDLVIDSFHGNGQLSWRCPGTSGVYRVEWASSPTGTWKNSWLSLLHLGATSTNSSMSATVPMFYRVAWSTNTVDVVGGYWFSALEGGNHYFFESNGVFRVLNAGRNAAGAYLLSGQAVLALASETNGAIYCLAGTVTGNSMVADLKLVDENGCSSRTNHPLERWLED